MAKSTTFKLCTLMAIVAISRSAAYSSEGLEAELRMADQAVDVRLDGFSFATPIIQGGSIFVASPVRSSDGKMAAGITCLDSETLQQRWRHSGEVGPRSRFTHGATAKPLIEAGKLFYVDSQAVVHCLSATDGEQIFKVDLRKSIGVNPVHRCPGYSIGYVAAIAQYQDLLILSTGHNEENHPPELQREIPWLVAINKKSGEIVWKLDGKFGSSPQLSSPFVTTVAGRPLIIQACRDGLVYGIRLDQRAQPTIVWQFESRHLLSQADGSERKRPLLWLATPQQVGNVVLLHAGRFMPEVERECYIYALDISVKNCSLSCRPLWSRPTSANHSYLIDVKGAAVLVDGEGRMQRLDLLTGEVLAESNVDSQVWARPLVHRGGLVVAGYDSCRLHFVDLDDDGTFTPVTELEFITNQRSHLASPAYVGNKFVATAGARLKMVKLRNIAAGR